MTEEIKVEAICFLAPTPGRVVIKEDHFTYHGRLAIPETAKRRPTTGVIVAVGLEVQPELCVGTRVIYGQFSGTLIQFKSQPAFRILGQEEVLARILSNEDLELEGTGA